MSGKLFSSGRTVDSVAYDLALALASRDKSISTPEELLKRIESLLPESLVAVQSREPEQARTISLD